MLPAADAATPFAGIAASDSGELDTETEEPPRAELFSDLIECVPGNDTAEAVFPSVVFRALISAVPNPDCPSFSKADIAGLASAPGPPERPNAAASFRVPASLKGRPSPVTSGEFPKKPLSVARGESFPPVSVPSPPSASTARLLIPALCDASSDCHPV